MKDTVPNSRLSKPFDAYFPRVPDFLRLFTTPQPVTSSIRSDDRYLPFAGGFSLNKVCIVADLGSKHCDDPSWTSTIMGK